MTSAPERIAPPPELVALAVANAHLSPCAKSMRGAVLFVSAGRTKMHASGWNKPALGECQKNDACRAACARHCVHAEQMALVTGAAILTHAKGQSRNVEMIHAKAAPLPGGLVSSGPPSCIECSKLMLLAGVTAVWLFHEAGWKRYEMQAFHKATLETLGLPVPARRPGSGAGNGLNVV